MPPIASPFVFAAALIVQAYPLCAGNQVLRSFPIKASQGVAVDGEYIYAISNTEIRKCDKVTGAAVTVWKADTKRAEFKHFRHLNSGTVIDGKLHCAHSRFPVAPNECTVEIWDVTGEKLDHVETIRMPPTHGSLTWIDRRGDGTWWMCYAVYGRAKNKETKLIHYRRENGKFIEEKSHRFPEEAVASWGTMSCSGGSWGPDGMLYATGHDLAEACVLRIHGDKLEYVRTEGGVGFCGQAIAWDRFSKEPGLWGIVKNKCVSLTVITAAKGKS
ncbi:hypothetical protein HZ994_10810 [Akkermansiaceae bacterium]|nr:hypothetical protein HZ994_10810 [Akkermansiaceae bacterium]